MPRCALTAARRTIERTTTEQEDMMKQPDAVDAAVDEQRRHLHQMWGAVAVGWRQHAPYVDSRAAAITDRMLELADVQPGGRVLELACGAGGAGLAAARRVGPDGHVVVSDVAAEMVAIAADRVATAGLDNVSTRRLDVEDIDEPDANYDVVLCRDGLQFASDPARATAEIRRVLRPGGRAALALWGPRARNPWLGVVLDCVSAHLGRPMPPPGLPGPFALEDADDVTRHLVDAGLSDVVVREYSVPLQAASFDDWWNRTTALAGPIAAVLASMPDHGTAALRARAQDAVGPYETPSGLQFPGVALLASGRRPL